MAAVPTFRTSGGVGTVDIARKFMTTLLNLPQVRTLLSSEHFPVDGTLIEAWASMKSFVPKDSSRPPSSGAGHVRGGGRNAARAPNLNNHRNDKNAKPIQG